MALPLFFNQDIVGITNEFFLSEETSKHTIQVLRMQRGEQLQLTDGAGDLFTVEIIDENRKKCCVKVLSTTHVPATKNKITIAISLLKINSRFEWFLEKATEIGISQIIPILCERTEKQHFKYERMNSILVSAMLQSQQVWKPLLNEPVKFMEYLNFVKNEKGLQKVIAHCEDENNKVKLSNNLLNKKARQLILIGPEGDFTKTEIETAIANDFISVSLGNTRLRTETAGIVAAAMLCNF